MPHRLFDHTADIGIEATSSTDGGALSEAGVALTEVLTGRRGRSPVQPDRELAFTIEAPDLPSLAVAFLSELLWLAESEDALWLGGGVTVAQSGATWTAAARGNAVRHDAMQHGRGVEVKAVTYSGLLFQRQEGGGWVLRVLLDI